MRPHRETTSDTQRARFASAAELAGLDIKKWHNESTLEVKHRNHRHKLHAPTLLARHDAQHDNPVSLAAVIAAHLDHPLPDHLLNDPEPIRHLLRPRITDPALLKGRNKAAVRRDATDGLIHTVAVGTNPNARLVRTRELDAWHATFDDVLLTATNQLTLHITTEHTHLVEGTAALFAVVHETERTDAAHLILNRLLPGFVPDNGALFALPAQRTLLALPIEPSVGTAGLAALLQTAFVLTQPDDPRRGHVYWLRDTHLQTLPTTRFDEDGQTRLQLELAPDIRDLLKRLGDDPDAPTH